MIDLLILFIGVSLLLYVLLGGSDYGAGVLELLPAERMPEARTNVINRAMGPVWEANHMWLILVVVILFMGFPTIFTTLMVALHVPMLALLVGIVVRGSVFAFRHYDAIRTTRSQCAYTWLFGLSSLWSSLWLGIIVASLNRGKIDLTATNAWKAWFAPWWGLYPLAVGLFVTCIFVFLASVYLMGETDDVCLRNRFTRYAAIFNGLAVVAGGLVFLISLREEESLFAMVMRKPAVMGVMTLAGLLVVVLWRLINRRRIMLARMAAAGQVALILLGWYLLYAPDALVTVQGPVSFYATAAPQATLRQLVLALLAGSVLIFPSLFFLFRVFKFSGSKKWEARTTRPS